MAAALDLEIDDGRVGQYKGTHVERVRCNSRHREHFGARNDDRASVGKRIGRRARRRGDDQAVCLIGMQILTVDTCADTDHRGSIAFQDGHIVEGTAIGAKRRTVGFHLYQRS